jgi:hypothetical protein
MPRIETSLFMLDGPTTNTVLNKSARQKRNNQRKINDIKETCFLFNPIKQRLSPYPKEELTHRAQELGLGQIYRWNRRSRDGMICWFCINCPDFDGSGLRTSIRWNREAQKESPLQVAPTSNEGDPTPDQVILDEELWDDNGYSAMDWPDYP